MQKNNRKKKQTKGLSAAMIAAGIVVVIFSLISKFHLWQHYLICGGLPLPF